MAMTIEVFSHALMGLSPNTFLFWALFLPVLLMVRVLCSACRTCFYVFSKHLVTNPGLCIVQQLVAYVICSDVRRGTHALLILWRRFYSVFAYEGKRWVDKCC